MAQQYINGELVDDGQDDQSYSPMAGLQSTSTPNRQGQMAGNYASMYENPEWSKGIDFKGINVDTNWLKQIGQENNINPADWGRGLEAYNQWNPIQDSLSWWNQQGPDGQSSKRALLSGIGMLGDTYKGFDAEKYLNRDLENSQSKSVANAYHAAHDNQGGGFFDSLLPLLLVGGLGLATGGFGFGAGAAAGEGALAAGGASFAPEAFSSAFVPNASVAAGGMSGLPSFLTPATAGAAAGASAGDWAGDFGGDGSFVPDTPAPTGTLADIPFKGGSDPGLFDLFNQGGIDFEGAGNFLGGNAEASATNLEQLINTPQQIPNVDLTAAEVPYTPDTVGPIDPANPATGLDNSGWVSGQDLPGGADFSTKDRFLNSLKGIKNMTNSPYFQVPKTLYSLYSQNQKAKQLEGMMKMMQEKSDVGGPFRDMLMRSYTDPNFFKSMPEFGAGMEAFNQQFGATAAQKGLRSQLGGAAHNIAVNREGARLADMFRSRLAGPASQGPDMRSMAAMAPAVAEARGNQFNTLLNPQLWNSLKDMF